MFLNLCACAVMVAGTIAPMGQTTTQPVESDGQQRREEKRFAEFEKSVLGRKSALKSLTADVTINFEGSQNESWVKSVAKGAMECLIRGDKVMWRCELVLDTTTTTAGEELKTTAEQLLLDDGKYYYTYGTDQYATEENKDKKYVFRLPQDPIQSSIVTKGYLDVFKRDYDVRVLEDEKIDGKKVWVMEAVRSSGPAMKTVIYVRKDVPLVVRSVNYDRYGTKIGESNVKDIKINAKVDPQRFIFKPDPEAEFVDLAGSANP